MEKDKRDPVSVYTANVELTKRIEELKKSKEGAVDVCRALIALNEDGDRVVPIETVKLMAEKVVDKEDDGLSGKSNSGN